MSSAAAAVANARGAGLSAAQRLLVAAASVTGPTERRALVETALAAGVDGAELLREARRHAVVPLVERALATVRDERLAAARERLATEARAIARRSLALAGAAVRLGSSFSAASVPVAFYKGPLLARMAYGSLALRDYADLDLVVRRRDFRRAWQLLADGGFRLHRDEWASIRHLGHEVPFEHPDDGVQVDLHRSVLSRELMALGEDEIWAEVRAVELDGRSVPTFSDELTLWILCEHAHKHLWLRLSWLADVAQFVAARPHLDWERCTFLARRAGGDRVVGSGLLAAADLLGAPVTTSTLARFRDDAVTVALAGEITARLFHPDPAESPGPEVARLQWRARRRWRDRLRILATPNESDWILLPLPAALSFLYYGVRFVRLVGEYGWSAPRRSS